MSVELFLREFELLAELPGAVAKLRDLILELAFHGRLVAPDGATVLVLDGTHIRNQGGRRKRRSASAAEPDAALCSDLIPATWKWATLEQIAQIIRGVSYSKHDASDSPRIDCLALLRAHNINGSINTDNLVYVPTSYVDPIQRLATNDILVCMASGSERLVGKTAQVQAPIDAAFGAFCGVIRPDPHLNPRYLAYFLHSPSYRRSIQSRGKGMGINNIQRRDLDTQPVPVAPISEQHRIVEKLDQLMSLCDELESRQVEQRERRARLSTVLLDRLVTSADADGCEVSWRWLYEQFDLACSSGEQIRRVRATVTQLAVEGKISAQSPSDESADALLPPLAAVQATGASRRDYSIDAACGLPFEVPTGWRWVRIGEVAANVDYGSSEKASPEPLGVPILRMNNIQDGEVNLSNLKYVGAATPDLPRLYLRYDDLLFNRTNSAELVGKTGIFKGESGTHTFASYLIRLSLKDGVDPDYVNLAMNAPYFRETQIVPGLTQQCGQANFNGTKLQNTMIPLPPTAEQRRIVERLQFLHGICDSLESGFTRAQVDGSKLLDAMIRSVMEAPVQESLPNSAPSNGNAHLSAVELPEPALVQV